MGNIREAFRTIVARTFRAEPGSAASICTLLTIEGILFTVVMLLINNNNLLFAIRLGADDTQIGILSSLPQFVGMALLIPAGILIDRLKNKRIVVIMSLLLLTITYIVCSFVPALPAYRFYAFLIIISISIAPLTIYNTSWQAYFSDITLIEERNVILTSKNKWVFFVSMIVPLISGALLASADSTEEKLRIHQWYFWIAGIFLLLQVYVLTRIKSNRTGVASQK